jgi:hypothetical protein
LAPKGGLQITNSQQPSPGLAGMEGKDWGQFGPHPEEIGVDVNLPARNR